MIDKVGGVILKDKKILIVTHGGVIYAIHRIFGFKVRTIENLEIVTIEY